MALFLVRHAIAGSPVLDSVQNLQRPLDSAGILQAEAIATELASRPVKRILSSPATRCISTVEPLARALKLKTKIAAELAEAVSIDNTIELLNSLAKAPGDSVLSSHGDVIPAVIWTLDQAGLNIPDRHRCKKASIWELIVENGKITAAVYRHPKTFGATIPKP